MRRVASAIIAVSMITTVCGAQTTAWKLDKAHSQAKFTVAHLVISEVTGFFRDFDITMVTNKDDFTDANIETIIKASSIETGNERRDNHLRGDDFFDAVKFPEIKFKSTMIEKTGESAYRITGDLTIRGVTKSVVLDTKHKGILTDVRGSLRSVFKATTTIDRFDFGVKWDRLIEGGGLVAGKDVDITLSMEFTSGEK
ncbi:MAG: YceI family protein [Bacteroidetes bacterium]|nr:YceI family protein [Bacteroidota bacterium]